MGFPFGKLRKVAYIITAVLAGIQIFLLLTSLSISAVQFNNNFHKSLFNKHQIYSHVSGIICSSMAGFLNNLKNNSPQDFELHSQVFSMLQKSTTPDMIAENLDSFRDGLFDYFKGKRQFLPDIYLTPQGTNAVKSGTDDLKKVSDKLAGISKINLNAVLIYINRTDISNYLSFIKFIYYILSQIPGISLPILVFMIMFAVAISKRLAELIKWLGLVFLSCSIPGFLSVAGLAVFNYLTIPANISPVAMSLPIPRNVILAYISDCIMPAVVFMLAISSLMLALWKAAGMVLKFFPALLAAEDVNATSYEKMHKVLRLSAYTVMCIIFICITLYKVHAVSRDFVANDFASIISRIKNVSTSTKVISASNDTIYSLEVKLVYQKQNKPVANTRVNVNGKSYDEQKIFNEVSTTDETGVAKFTLDKGSYYLSFTEEAFPEEYRMPAPVFFDLKSSGTTIITVNLEKNIPDNGYNPGIAEIEVLGSDNKPLQGVELSISNPAPASGHPDIIYSYTGSDGIAIFKMNEGTYKVVFESSKLPKKYSVPEPIDIVISANETARYTVRLSAQ